MKLIREKLHEKWLELKDTVHASGSHQTLTGPTYAFVIYLKLFKKFPDRFLTGTDFVSSMGEPEEYPGMKRFKEVPTGCMKDEANHRRQVTDTSAVNIFFDDATFKKVVLGCIGESIDTRCEIEAQAYEHCVKSGQAKIGRTAFDSIRQGKAVDWGKKQLWESS